MNQPKGQHIYMNCNKKNIFAARSEPHGFISETCVAKYYFNSLDLRGIILTTVRPAGKLFPVEYSTRNFQNIHNIQKFVYVHRKFQKLLRLDSDHCLHNTRKKIAQRHLTYSKLYLS